MDYADLLRLPWNCVIAFRPARRSHCCSYRAAGEQKARTTYDNILRLTDDPDVREVIKFLRQRELVHYQRFGEALRYTQDKLDSKNFYAFNPEFDYRQAKSMCESNCIVRNR